MGGGRGGSYVFKWEDPVEARRMRRQHYLLRNKYTYLTRRRRSCSMHWLDIKFSPPRKDFVAISIDLSHLPSDV